MCKAPLNKRSVRAGRCYCYFCTLGREPQSGPAAHLKRIGHTQREPEQRGVFAGDNRLAPLGLRGPMRRPRAAVSGGN